MSCANFSFFADVLEGPMSHLLLRDGKSSLSFFQFFLFFNFFAFFNLLFNFFRFSSYLHRNSEMGHNEKGMVEISQYIVLALKAGGLRIHVVEFFRKRKRSFLVSKTAI